MLTASSFPIMAAGVKRAAERQSTACRKSSRLWVAGYQSLSMEAFAGVRISSKHLRLEREPSVSADLMRGALPRSANRASSEYWIFSAANWIW